MPADPGVRLIIDYADTADIGMSSAPSANRRRVYHDRAVVVTVAIMQIGRQPYLHWPRTL